MKFLKLFSLMIVLSLVLFSCEKEAFDTLIGNWNTSDGGTVSFVADGTGTTSGSDFLDFGISDNFVWTLRDTADLSLLSMEFSDSMGSSGSIELPMEVIKKNEVYLGIDTLDLNITLTRQ